MGIPSSNHTQALIDACSDGDLDRLRSLLDDFAISAKALSDVDSTSRGKPHKISNLHNLVERAAKSGYATLVSFLSKFPASFTSTRMI